MDNHTTLIDDVRDEICSTIDDLVRRGAQRMLEAALQAEVENYLQHHRQERDENGYALVVRNGRSQERTVQYGAGALKIKAPRVAQTAVKPQSLHLHLGRWRVFQCLPWWSSAGDPTPSRLHIKVNDGD